MNRNKMIEWIGTHDAGASSKAMWVALMEIPGITPNDIDYDVPHDSGDFSLCYDLCEYAKISLNDLRKIEKVFPYWKPIIDEWDSLASAYTGMRHDCVRAILDSKHEKVMRLRDEVRKRPKTPGYEKEAQNKRK